MSLSTIHDAQQSLPQLIERAIAGEEIVIGNDHNPLVQLVPCAQKERTTPQESNSSIARLKALDAIVGIWEDRSDIGDGVEYQRKLRAEWDDGDTGI